MKDKINTTEKVDILISALEERYKALHVIRERVQNVGVWLLGIFLASGGWLLQNDITLSLLQQTVYMLGILSAVAVIRLRYLEDLETGFKSQQLATARIEKTLGLFTPGIYDDESDSVYPKKWEDSGKGNGGGKFFRTTYLLISVGAAFLFIIVLMKGNIICYL